MATADKQIRVSNRVKQLLDRRRQRNESYNDVLERILEEHAGANFSDGFGLLSDDDAEWIHTIREDAKEKRKQRMRQSGETS